MAALLAWLGFAQATGIVDYTTPEALGGLALSAVGAVIVVALRLA